MNAKAVPFSLSKSERVEYIPVPSIEYHELTRGIDSIPNRYMEQRMIYGYNQSSTGLQPIIGTVQTYCSQDFDLHSLPKEEQQKLLDSKLYSIDVECVATGTRHCDRDVAKIAIVNAMCDVVFESFVKPQKKIVSYLTPLTGIIERDLENAPSLEECLKEIRSILPHDCTLVGQGINHDIYWLGLKLEKDFANCIDLLYMFCYKRFPSTGSKTKCLRLLNSITTFSLRQVVLTLIGIDIQNSWHNPRVDAIYSMKLYLLFRNCTTDELNLLRKILVSQPRLPSFSQHMGTIEGVDLKKKGSCVDCRERDYRVLEVWNSVYDWCCLL